MWLAVHERILYLSEDYALITFKIVPGAGSFLSKPINPSTYAVKYVINLSTRLLY